MRWIHVLWDADDDPTGNVQHIADNFLTTAGKHGRLRLAVKRTCAHCAPIWGLRL